MILITTAIEEELTAIRSVLAAAKNLRFAAIGIGCIDAAVALSQLLQDEKFRLVIFAGSAGASDRSVPLLSAAVATSVRLSEAAVVSNDASFPAPTVTSYQTAESVLENVREALPADTLYLPFYTTLPVTRSESLAAAYQREFGSAAENLELFSVAHVCAKQAVPWLGVSIITNHTGAAGHQQWRENREAAAVKTAEVLSGLLLRVA